jgi:hypothetical protein
MECAVYDTYVTKKDGKTMHFDVIVEAKIQHEKAIEYGKQYLERCWSRRTENDTRRVSVLSYPRSSQTSRTGNIF